MAEAVGHAWPEQEAVERWWGDVRLALKEGVTAPRLAVEKRVTRAVALLNDLKQALMQVSGDPKLTQTLLDELTHIIAVLEGVWEG